MPDSELAPGTVVIEAHDPDGAVVRGAEITLRVLQRSPAIGERHSELHARTDDRGVARFLDLTGGSERHFSAKVAYAGATYTTDPFRLEPDRGIRATVYVFPSTSDLEKTHVGSLCFIGISLKDDVFQVDVTLRIINVGRVTWLPDGYRFELPTGYRAFLVPEDAGPVRFIEGSSTADLTGTVSPGEHEATFRFQIENPSQSFLPWEQQNTILLDLKPPPRVLRSTVWVDRAPGMRLGIAGFEPASVTRSHEGVTGLVATWAASDPSSSLSTIPIRLDGIPRRGSGPFFTVLGALLLLGWGIGDLWSRPKRRGPAPEDASSARERLLQELMAVERAFRTAAIGPRTRDQARRTLLEALARLEDLPASPRRFG